MKERPKRYYEAEFRVWVEEPDPLEKEACGVLWNGEWDHAVGARPSCFREKDHAGEHHDTRTLEGDGGWLEYYWTDDPKAARTELRRPAP